MDPRRRSFLSGLAAATGLAASTRGTAAQHVHPSPSAAAGAGTGSGRRPPVRLQPVDRHVAAYRSRLRTFPSCRCRWTAVKEFHLIAEPVRTEFLPGRAVDAWGFNGTMPGPTIEVNEGDRVRIIFENQLPEMTALHWHGFEVPIEMDGVPGISQDPIQPGGALHLRVHAAPARHVLLPLAHADAGDDGHDRLVHHPSARRRTSRASIATSA